MSKTHQNIKVVIWCLLLVTHWTRAQLPSKTPPNVILILADDLGIGDLGSYGATTYKTPHLDQMAVEGIRFTNFDVSHPICSASRASFLTGCYANRVGIHGALGPHANHGLDPSEKTIADLLKERGYVTAAIGKWHLGHLNKYLPLQQGFDSYLGLPYSNDMVPYYYDGSRNIPDAYKRKLSYPELPLMEGNTVKRRLKTLKDQEELTTLYTKRAIEVIEENKTKPFFIYLAHSMPHVPLAVSDKFKGKSKQGLYGDVIMEMDWSVGKILKALKDNGLEENTLVIFTSDNGPWLNFGNHAGSTAGLREGKASSFEGGQRVPFIALWKGKITPGTVSNEFMASIDVFPTIAALVEGQLPDKKIDGMNVSAALLGQGTSVRSELLYYYNKNSLQAIRKNQFKLVFPHDYRSYEDVVPGVDGLPGEYSSKKIDLALYDLRRDPGERYNVIEQHPEIVKELKTIAAKARNDLGDRLQNMDGNNRRINHESKN